MDRNNRTIYYEIRPGDSLFSIARKYNTTLEEILSLNDIENPNDIYAGEIIKLPFNNYYEVVRGDTLYTISRRFGTTIGRLVRLNNLKNPNLIYPGMIIQIR